MEGERGKEMRTYVCTERRVRTNQEGDLIKRERGRDIWRDGKERERDIERGTM